MDWLRSEDLKEEKVVTAPFTIVAAYNKAEVVIQIDLWATRTHEIMG